MSNCFNFLLFQNTLQAYSSDPKEFITELIGDVINKLSDKNLSTDEKAKFIEELAIDNVDIQALGLYTLGELRKSSNEEDLRKYQKTFEKYFLKSLTSRLTDYSSSKFKVTGTDKKSSNYTIINTKVSPSMEILKFLLIGGFTQSIKTSYKGFNCRRFKQQEQKEGCVYLKF